jgi:hypothetical protein
MATTPYPFVAGAVLTASQLNSTFNVPVNNQTASYVLLASDGGKRVVMNAAGATTITVNNSVFSAGDSVWIHNIGAGTCTITAGTATVTTTGSLALAQWGGGSLYFTSASAAIFFPAGGISYGVATGGTALSSPPTGYSGVQFTTDGTLTVTKAGLFDVLLVGGGGGGNLNTGVSRSWGGGGGGQVIGYTSLVTVYLAVGTVSIDVGAGGAQSSNGLPTNFGSLVTACGGGRESSATEFDSTTRPYGSGGGGSNGNIGIDTLGTINVNNGGDADTGQNAAGGGGGAAGAGGNKVNATTGGAGGNGLDISGFIGGATYYAGAGGGGGGSGTGGAAGNGGVAGKTSGNANNGVNYGAGGGGSHGSGLTGGAGAAGAVFIRWKV